jgi:hypothetical protein
MKLIAMVTAVLFGFIVAAIVAAFIFIRKHDKGEQ